MNFKRFARVLLSTGLMVIISACSSISSLDKVVKDNREKYQKATVLPPLAVPPDLSSARINDEFADEDDSETYIEFDGAAQNPLTKKYNVAPSTKPALMDDGQQQYLIVYGQENVLWQRMLGFWAEQNITVKRQDQSIGMMDTNPDDDDYAYRTRLETGGRLNSVKMYINSASFNNDEQKNEAKLRQLADYMGRQYQADKQVAAEPQSLSEPSQIRTPAPTTQAVVPVATANVEPIIIDEAGDFQALLVDLSPSETWRRLGQALEGKQFVIQDRDRDMSTYFVQYLDPFLVAKNKERSLVSKMAFWQGEQDYAPEMFNHIKVVNDEGQSKIIIKDIDQVRTASSSARRLLRLLQEKLAY